MSERCGPTMWLLSDKGRDTMILILAWAAGSLDAIGYLGLGHVFTANMTGNAVLLGLALGQGYGVAALPGFSRGGAR